MRDDRRQKPKTGRPRINTQYVHIGLGQEEIVKLNKVIDAGGGPSKMGLAEAVRYVIRNSVR